MKISIAAKNFVAVIKDDEGNTVLSYTVVNYELQTDLSKLVETLAATAKAAYATLETMDKP